MRLLFFFKFLLRHVLVMIFEDVRKENLNCLDIIVSKYRISYMFWSLVSISVWFFSWSKLKFDSCIFSIISKDQFPLSLSLFYFLEELAAIDYIYILLSYSFFHKKSLYIFCFVAV